MKFPERIDLHMHSTVSDGTDQPAEIIGHARDTGLELFSLSDHDAVKGCRIVLENLTESDPRFITGVEFSCKDEKGKYHILGYGYAPDSAAINRLINKGHSIRVSKLGKRLALLKKDFGITFSREDIDSLYGMENPGKPHIAGLLVKDGYVQTKQEAFSRILEHLEVVNEYLNPGEAIEGILGADGIPVLAHPFYGDGDQLILGREMDERLQYLIPMGLKGVEAYYSGFTDMMINQMLALAEQYDLYVTAGSDYHGKNKLVEMGNTNLEKVSNGSENLRRFLENVLK